ncbi:hypothetical protein TRICI_001395 [Trichomonascus ciferrii]|uniref:Ubiquitin carboxyl-terminal hydrolase n=1 Tax=Trichomonascus ciferrii TaxID=44093 RepID=A0A642V8T6_9ASCO|nr:hypothetical protein TRICI_001395 [Trichomonascus ciferrii]
MLEAAYINYWQAYLIITRCVPDHPDYGRFSSKITSPFYETYVDLIELISRDAKVQELEKMINDRASKAKKTARQNVVARKPVGSTPSSKDDLTARFERLRVPKGPRPSPAVYSNGKVGADHDTTPASLKPQPPPPPQSYPEHERPHQQPPPSFPLPPPPTQAAPPPPQSSSSPVLFPKTTVINAETLLSYLERIPESILLLDIRSRYEYDRGHISAPNVVCVEPIILRANMNDQDLEDALILNPDFEQRAFLRRDSFDLVVYYDSNSSSYSTDLTLQNLLHAVYHRAFSKRLKRPPCILAGGFDTWMDDFNGAHITVSSSASALAPPKPLQASTPDLGPSANQQYSRSQDYIKDINGYFKAPPQPQYVQPQQPIAPPQPQYYHHHQPTSVPGTPPQMPTANGYKYGQPPAPNYSTRPTSATVSAQGTDVILTQSNQLRIAALEFTTGLQNLGNTCYMNCIIQCLAGTPSLSILLVDGSYKRYVNVNNRLGYRGMLVQKFAELVQTMFRGNVAYVGPTALKDLSGRLRDTFRGCEQQDCQEFLTFILDGLHEDLNVNGDKERLKELTEAEERRREGMSVRLASTIEWERYLKSDYSPIVDTMQGQYQSQLKCLACGNTSTTYNVFSFLSLPIPLNHQTVSLKDCFDLFTQDEILDNDNAWHCSHCKKPRRAVKKLIISRLPQVLIIHLKRFQQRARGTNKLETFVTYPTSNLNLTDYWPSYTGNDDAKLSQMPKRGQSPPFQYDLYGVANHFGTLKGGHYTAFVRKGSKGWCYFDDVRISRSVPSENVVNQHAYVLFYQRRMTE